MEPYYCDEYVTLYCGDMRDVLPLLDKVDVCITDPPYGETSLPWDSWPSNWPDAVASLTQSMWCFGSMRMFLDRRAELSGWRMSQDVVWEKNNGSSFAADRFRRVHEHVVHWYRGAWSAVYHEAVREARVSGGHHGGSTKRRSSAHTGTIDPHTWSDDGTRLARSVLYSPAEQRGIHPTQKPEAVLSRLVQYSAPAGGVVLDPFAGSCSTLVAARRLGRRSIGVEADPDMCEKSTLRLANRDLFGGVA